MHGITMVNMQKCEVTMIPCGTKKHGITMMNVQTCYYSDNIQNIIS